MDRRIMPSCYSIRNRDSSNYVMLSWRLEASNDLVNWSLLDTRTTDQHDEDIVARMSHPGAMSTWGIDTSVYEQLGVHDGFNSFRIVQIDMNSSGTHNLSLSGFEIYGKPTNPAAW